MKTTKFSSNLYRFLNLSLFLFLCSFITQFSVQHRAFAKTCYLQDGYKVYKIRRNGSKGRRDKRIGNTHEQAYECVRTSRYYLRIELQPNKWRYVSTQAETKRPEPKQTHLQASKKNIKDDSATKTKLKEKQPVLSSQNEDISNIFLPTTKSLRLEEDFLVYNNEGDRFATTYGLPVSEQNAQIMLNFQGLPIRNEEGYVRIKLNSSLSSSRANSAFGWVKPAAIQDFDTEFNSRIYDQALTKLYFESDDDSDPKPKKNQLIQVHQNLESAAVRAGPNLTSSYVNDLDDGLASGTDLIATGNRECDKDSKKCFVEVWFRNNEDVFSGWIDEKDTNLDPKFRNAKVPTETEVVDIMLNKELGSSGDDVQDLNINDDDPPSWYEKRFTRVEKAFHKRFNQVIKSMPKPIIHFENNRGLIRMHNSRAGFCSSYRYSTETSSKAGSSNEIQTYAKPTSGCVIARLMQTWKKYHCPNGGNDNGCRLSTGDISHRSHKYFDSHRTHTHGECMDIRPMRKSGVGALTYKSSSYDREKTKELIKVLKKLGGTNIHFNDPKLRKKGYSTYAGGHANHIHVCFKEENKTVKKSCTEYKPDYNVCPSLMSFFGNSLMKKFDK